jgi:hypothetical protein
MTNEIEQTLRDDFEGWSDGDVAPMAGPSTTTS